MQVSPNDQRRIYKYRVRNYQVLNGAQRIDMIASNIISLEIFNDYEQLLHSIFKVTLQLDTRKRIYMLQHKKDITIKLELEKVGYDVEIEEKITTPESVFNVILVPFFDDDEENDDIVALHQRLAQNTVEITAENPLNDENYHETQNIIEFYMFNQVLLKASRFLCNRVYTEGTLQNIVGHLLGISKHKNVLMSRFENIEIYKELLVPPNQFYKNLIYLDQYFGFYKKGAMIFYDIDCLYIINANGKVTAKRRNEKAETVFLIPKVVESTPGQGMLYKPGEQINYCVVSENDVNPQKGAILQNASVGANVKIAFTDGTEMATFKSGADSIDGENTSIHTIKKDNKYTGDMMATRIKENDVIMYITGTNLDLTAFTPNKIFKIVFDDTSKYRKYKGEYRLAYASHLLKAESENFSSASHHLILKKTK